MKNKVLQVIICLIIVLILIVLGIRIFEYREIVLDYIKS